MSRPARGQGGGHPPAATQTDRDPIPEPAADLPGGPCPVQTPEDVRRVVAALRQWLAVIDAPAPTDLDYSRAWDGFRAAFGRGRAGDAGIDGDGRADPPLIGSLIDRSTRQLSAEARRRLQEIIDEHPATSRAVRRIEHGTDERGLDRAASRQLGRLGDALIAAVRSLEAVGPDPAGQDHEPPPAHFDLPEPDRGAAETLPTSFALPSLPATPALTGEDPRGADPLQEFQLVVSELAACVEPLKTRYLEPYGKAEAAWRAAREAGHQRLQTLRRDVRRWLATHLPAELRLDAERELKAAEDAVAQLIHCPVPMPALPAGWSEDAEGNRHTFVGGSDQQHRAACARMTTAAQVALGSVVELDRFRHWAPAEHRFDRTPVAAAVEGVSERLTPAGAASPGADGQAEMKKPDDGAIAASDETVMAVVQLYVGGAASNDRIRAVAALVNNPDLTVNQKLTQIDQQLPIPAAASGEKLGEMLGVTKTAVVTSGWWKKNRSGKRQDEESRRLARHERRREEFEPPGQDEDR